MAGEGVKAQTTFAKASAVKGHEGVILRGYQIGRKGLLRPR